jgi:pyrroloquinoline quinone biosynthesis protein B
LFLLFLAILLFGGTKKTNAEDARPFVELLGTAQDAGIPQIAAHLPEDEAARRDPARRRLVSSLLIADPATGKRWLIDATPDLREQVERADAVAPLRGAGGVGRPPLFETIFLTHAHMGHVAGLLQLGREAYAAAGQRISCSPAMARFLTGNEPWALLTRLGHVAIEPFTAGATIRLTDTLTVTPLAVPHRGEISDTHAFVVRGPQRSVLYLPDIDRWDAWDRKLEDVLAGVDVAFLDGTFFDESELPGRKLEEIPHPLVRLTLERLAALPLRVRQRVVFIHLNHSNSAADPTSDARRKVLAAGMRVGSEGQREDL